MTVMASEHYVVVTSFTKDSRPNSPSHFYNKLDAPLILDGQWKVALKKMIYQNTFLTIVDEFVDIDYTFTQSVSHNMENSIGETINVPWWNYSFYVSEESRKIRSLVRGYEQIPIKNNITVKFTGKLKNESKVIPIGEYDYPNQLHSYNSYKIPERLFDDDENVLTAMLQCKMVHRLHIPKGTYKEIDMLLNTINEIIRNNVYKVFDPVVGIPTGGESPPNNIKRNALEFKLTRGGFVEAVCVNQDNYRNLKITLGGKLNTILGGFSEGRVITPNGEHTIIAQRLPQLNSGQFAFFLYTNLVGSSKVGDNNVPLLDVIGTSHPDGTVVHLDLHNPIYQPVIKRVVDDIEIFIANGSGEEIEFNDDYAKTLLLLHFVKQCV